MHQKLGLFQQLGFYVLLLLSSKEQWKEQKAASQPQTKARHVFTLECQHWAQGPGAQAFLMEIPCLIHYFLISFSSSSFFFFKYKLSFFYYFYFILFLCMMFCLHVYLYHLNAWLLETRGDSLLDLELQVVWASESCPFKGRKCSWLSAMLCLQLHFLVSCFCEKLNK